MRDDVHVDASQLVDLDVPSGAVTLAGIETNVEVALEYIEAWLRGQGAVAIHNLMEDAATAEISRSQLWQWVRNESPIADDGTMSAQGYRDVRERRAHATCAPTPVRTLDGTMPPRCSICSCLASSRSF